MNNIILNLLSMTLLAVGLYLYKKTSSTKIIMGIFSVMVVCCIFFLIVYAVAYYFTGNGIDEATIYHLKYGLHGAGFLEYGLFIFLIVLSVICITVVLLFYFFKFPRDLGMKKISPFVPFSFILLSFLFNPASINLYDLYGPFFGNKSEHASSTFHEYYKKPYVTSLEKVNKNIVFIYAESLERTYFDETLFPGLIKGLRELESTSTYFTNIKGKIDGTGWTVGGMIASQCGIPLFTPSHGNSMSGMDSFLPAAVCLGDILKQEGYNLNYMGGADLDFAGKGKLYKTHGFSSVQGRDELLPKLKDMSYKTDWGLYDDSLFDMLYERFTKLSEVGEKFGLFALTLDTHHPYGHTSRDCEKIKYMDASNSILNAVACSDYLISNFIHKIISSPYANNTVVILVSDHLAMRNTASQVLRKKERTNLFMIIDPSEKNPQEVRTIGSVLDIGTTLLPFIGFSGDIGLGRNLLDREALAGERLFIHSNLSNWKEPITAYWDFPRVQNSLEINLNEKHIKIEDREFKFPVLISLNENWESILRFELNKSRRHNSLVRYQSELNENEYFILIDKCKSVKPLYDLFGEEGYCLLAGYGNVYTEAMKLESSVKYSKAEIFKLLGIQSGFDIHRVAHAGGGVNNETYTNSFEALNVNLKKGFKYFEIDFSFTKDGRLVCLHDWEHSFKRSFGFNTSGKITLEEFNFLVKSKSKYRKCTASNLSDWMVKNPDTYIVTDVKEKNIEALKILYELFPDARTRVIPQVYFPENIDKVKNIGFEKIIWTLYRFRGRNKDVLDWVDKLAPLIVNKMAITMPKFRAESKLPRNLEERGVPSYVHTVNTAQEENKYTNKFRVTNLYTDFLKP